MIRTLALQLLILIAPHLFLDLTTGYGAAIQYCASAVQAALYPFVIIRQIFGLNCSLWPNGVILTVLLLAYKTLIQLPMYYPILKPWPFRVCWTSFAWLVYQYPVTYFLGFRGLSSEQLSFRMYNHGFFITMYMFVLFWVCVFFLFATTYLKYHVDWSDVVVGRCQLAVIVVFYAFCFVYKMSLQSVINWVQSKHASDSDDVCDGKIIRKFLSTVSLRFGCDFVQSYFVLVILPESLNPYGVVWMVLMGVVSLCFRFAMMKESWRLRLNDCFKAAIACNTNSLTRMANVLLRKGERETAADPNLVFKQSLVFGLSVYSEILSNLIAVIVLFSIYVCRNRELYMLSHLSWSQMNFTFITAAIDLSVTIIGAISFNAYFSRFENMSPMYHASLYIKHNLAMVMVIVGSGSFFPLVLLGKQYNAMWFMQNSM